MLSTKELLYLQKIGKNNLVWKSESLLFFSLDY